jgi:Fe-Mn family superoxide dismutase
MRFFSLSLALSMLLPLTTIANVKSSDTSGESHPFKLKDLPYAANSLLPYIDEETMTIHHGKHHKAYVDNLNNALTDKSKNLGQIMSEISKYPVVIRNNGGGHWNHTFFWSVMTPDLEKRKMSSNLKKRISKDFGNLEKFKQAFENAAATRFGSGWAWLLVDSKGSLKVTSTANQDNPLMDTEATRGSPLLAIDVWEHAYYLKYKNMRGTYLKEFWNVVNWQQVEAYLQEAEAEKR